MTSSNQFVVGEDNDQHRTAWAGAGSAVLFVDPNGANAIVNADQYVFSDRDPSASSDMQALEDVFDTNHDGKLDAGDAGFGTFKLMVTNADGTTSVETLAEAGITSIDLTANSVTQNFVDGSSIDGETTFTKADGSTGTAATVTFEQDANGTVLETPLVTTNPDGSTRTIAFDEAGNGIIDRRQTDDTVVGADGSETATESNTNGSGVLEDSTTTTTSADGSSVTIDRDLEGSGIIGQSETRQTAADGSITDTLTDLAADGSTIDQTVTTFSADGLSKFTQVDVDGDGTVDRGIGKVASVSATCQARPRLSRVSGPRRHRRPHDMYSRYCIQESRATNVAARHRSKQILTAGYAREKSHAADIVVTACNAYAGRKRWSQRAG